MEGAKLQQKGLRAGDIGSKREMEIWKDVEGYEGLYEVSNFGNVKRIGGKILKQEITKKGRCLVKLSKEGKTKKYQVHVLVAKHFIDNPYFYDCVNHIDENPRNNNANNLEWCTSWYNNCYSLSKHVLCENLITHKRKFYESINSTVYDGFNKRHVSAVCRGKENKHKNCVFKYVTNEKYVIGIDESYKRCGLTLLCDSVIVELKSIDFENCINNTEKRNRIKNELTKLCRVYRLDKRNCVCIVERIRLFSQNKISENYIVSTSAFVSVIIDTLSEYNIRTFSVNTKTWKSAIVGTSKPIDNPYGIDPHKYPTILYMRRMGLLGRIAVPYEGRGKKGIIPIKIEGKKVPCKINDDVADSYCIAMYGFLPKGKQDLKEEKF